MDAAQEDAFSCPVCGDPHNGVFEALECCQYAPPVKAWACEKCRALYKDKQEAEDCCTENE